MAHTQKSVMAAKAATQASQNFCDKFCMKCDMDRASIYRSAKLIFAWVAASSAMTWGEIGAPSRAEQ
jgi:hypothetical protein